MSLASLIGRRRTSRFSFWFEHPVDFAHQLQQLVGILFKQQPDRTIASRVLLSYLARHTPPSSQLLYCQGAGQRIRAGMFLDGGQIAAGYSSRWRRLISRVRRICISPSKTFYSLFRIGTAYAVTKGPTTLPANFPIYNPHKNASHRTQARCSDDSICLRHMFSRQGARGSMDRRSCGGDARHHLGYAGN
jgi:hypothetical protein